MADGATTDPQFNRTEHIDENISAKRAANYGHDGSNWQRLQVDGSGNLKVVSSGGAATIADGADVTQGAIADVAYVSGSGTVVSILKGIFTKLAGTLATSRTWVLGSGTDSVTTVPSGTQAVSGTFWQATQPVSLATNTPDVTDRAARLLGHITVDNASIAVTGTFFQATQPVSLATNTPTLQTGSNIVGKVGIDQTTDGTTNKVFVGNIPHVIVDTAPSTAVTNANLDVALSTRLKPADTLAGVTTVGTITNTVPVKDLRATTPAQTSISVTNSSTSVLASTAARLGATIWNEGTAICYLKLGATASTTSYSVQIASGGYYELPFNYTGAVDAITSASTAQLRITELT